MPGQLHAFGTQFQRGDGASPEVFTKLAHVITIGGPSLAREAVDATDHDSPDRWREFIGGLRDGGEITVELHYVPGDTGHDALKDDLESDAARNYRLVFPDSPATQWTVPALVTGLTPAGPHDAKLTATVTLKVSGKPTFA